MAGGTALRVQCFLLDARWAGHDARIQRFN